MLKENQKNFKEKKKIHPLRKMARSMLVNIILICGMVVVTVYTTFNKVANNFDTVILENNLGVVPEEELQQFESSNEILNIALFGIDSTDTSSRRSDSLIVATLDPIHNKVKLTYFMKDAYVYIDDYGYDKLKHAYTYGGPSLAINTLNTNFGLNITDFLAVDYSSLPEIIDNFGGITITITDDELNYINNNINSINSANGTNAPNIVSAGTQRLNGVQALAYSRIYQTSGGDFERTQRKISLLIALITEALNVSSTQYFDSIFNLIEYIKTSLDANTMMKLTKKISQMDLQGISIQRDIFPQKNYYESQIIDGTYYITFDAATTKAQVMNYIFNDKISQ